MTWNAIWHLFTKDLRRLAPWLALFAIALALDPNLLGRSTGQYAWVFGDSQAALATLSFAVLMVLLMQQENAVSLKAWWLSRPISRGGLLFEKLLFVLAVVLVLVVTYQLAVLQASATPIGPNVHSLLWSELFLVISFAVPCAALGAVSKNLAQAVMIAFLTVAGPALIFSTVTEPPNDSGMRPDWIPMAAFLIASAAAGGLAIAAQYVWRATLLARALLALGPLIGFGIASFLPLEAQLAVQTLTSRDLSAARNIHLYWDSREPGNPYRASGGAGALDIPIRIEGLSPHTRLVVDLVKPSMEISYPTRGVYPLSHKEASYVWTPDWEAGEIYQVHGSEAMLQLRAPSDASYRAARAPAQMRADLYLTLMRETGRLDPKDIETAGTKPKCKPGYDRPCGPLTTDTTLSMAHAGMPPEDLSLWQSGLPAPFPVDLPGSFTPLVSQGWSRGAALWGGNAKVYEIVMERPAAYFRLQIPEKLVYFIPPIQP